MSITFEGADFRLLLYRVEAYLKKSYRSLISLVIFPSISWSFRPVPWMMGSTMTWCSLACRRHHCTH